MANYMGGLFALLCLIPRPGASPHLAPSPAKCRQAVMDSLKDSRQPVIIEFFGDLGGHAVLAYKLIEVEGRDPVVYVYDSNSPEPNVKPPRPITQITLQPSQDYWRYPTYMGYNWAYPHNISAHKVFREIPLQRGKRSRPISQEGRLRNDGDNEEGQRIHGRAQMPGRCGLHR